MTGLLGFAWLGPVVGPLSTAGLIAVMVIFMLLERRDLRDRLIGLIGHGQLATTTKAFDEAGSRVSRQLLMQTLVSLLSGIAVFGELYCLSPRPYPLVWATLGAALRFIPYVGPVPRGRCADPRQSRRLAGVDSSVDRPRLLCRS